MKRWILLLAAAASLGGFWDRGTSCEPARC
jgi:hypothetical protein